MAWYWGVCSPKLADLRLASILVVAPPMPSSGSTKVGEVELVDDPRHFGVEGREIQFRPRRIGLGQELHADRIQRRRDRRG